MKMHSYFRISLLLALVIHSILAVLVLLSLYLLDSHPKPTPMKDKRLELSLKEPRLPTQPSASNVQKTVPSSVPVSTTAPVHTVPITQTGVLPTPQTAFSKSDGPSLPSYIKRHYGDDFFELSRGQQEYILNNLQKIRQINDIVGNRLLQNKPQENLENRDNNYVEFILHPDGSISDMYLRNERSDSLLDELTLETIELAHSQYPKPQQKTLIRIRVWILIK